MDIKTVSITYGRKFNLGDFNSAHLECSLWADVEDGDDLNEAMHALWEMAKENVKSEAMPLIRNDSSVDVSEYFLGFPLVKDEPEKTLFDE